MGYPALASMSEVCGPTLVQFFGAKFALDVTRLGFAKITFYEIKLVLDVTFLGALHQGFFPLM